jgi:hypothetical protein
MSSPSLTAPALPACAGLPSHATGDAIAAAVVAVVVMSVFVAILVASRRPGIATRTAVRALVQAALAGDEAAAYRSLGRTSALVRPFARRHIARALREAWAGAESDAGAGLSEADTARRAAVALANGAAPRDPEALAAAFAALEAAHTGVAPPWRAPLYVLAAIGVAGVAVAIPALVRRADDGRLRALLQKGVPRYRMDLNNTLVRKAGEAAGTVDQRARAALDAKRAELVADVARTRLGTQGATALGDLLAEAAEAAAGGAGGAASPAETPDAPEADAAATAAVAAKRAAALDEAVRALGAHAGAFDRVLEDHGAPMLVATDVTVRNGRRTVQLFTFEVEERASACVAGRRVRLAHVRRLDEVAWSINGLALVDDGQGLVVLDEVEKLLVRELLPALAPDGDPTASVRMGEAERAAVRAELPRIAGWDEAEAREVGSMLASRRAILSRVSRGDVDRFESGIAYETWKGRAPDGDLAELQRIESRMALRRDGYAKLERALAISTERYAAQAVRDAEPDAAHPMPAELTALTGESPAVIAQAGVIARWIGADLGELGANDAFPRTQLGLLTSALDDPGNYKWYAAVVMVEVLGRELGLAVDPKSRASVLAAKDALLAKAPDALTAAARAARRKLYGDDGVTPTRCADRTLLGALGVCR